MRPANPWFVERPTASCEEHSNQVRLRMAIGTKRDHRSGSVTAATSGGTWIVHRPVNFGHAYTHWPSFELMAVQVIDARMQAIEADCCKER